MASQEWTHTGINHKNPSRLFLEARAALKNRGGNYCHHFVPENVQGEKTRGWAVLMELPGGLAGESLKAKLLPQFPGKPDLVCVSFPLIFPKISLLHSRARLSQALGRLQ